MQFKSYNLNELTNKWNLCFWRISDLDSTHQMHCERFHSELSHMEERDMGLSLHFAVDIESESVLVCLGCNNKVLQTR